ncbi:MAG TPA: cell wall hydrolase [Pseudobdellovibrionaceae bacterium]|nr:cell wall hydrolase [Pseudobdellovibrionaceae bacterium]
MTLHRFVKHSLLCGVLCLSQTSYGALGHYEEEEAVAQGLSGPVEQEPTSLGAPMTYREQISLQFGSLESFETAEDDADVANMDSWTDDQIESYYEEQLETTRDWLERATGRPEVLNLLNQYQVAAAKGKTKKSGMTALSCMAVAIQGEAGGEPYAGKVAVGETIMARAGGKSSRVCAAIFAKAQFESMAKGRLPKANAESLKAAKATLAKGGKCGYDHFINKKLQVRMGRKIPQWVRNFEKWKCATKTVGQHTFYSSCNCKRK